MPKVTFVDCAGAVYQIDARNGYTLMETARDNDVPGIEAECGGAGACATCHVYIDSAWVGICGPAGQVESELLSLVEDPREESRLSCQISISDELDGLIVRLPETQGF